MIRLEVEQGSAEWVNARLGIPTASEFDKILTPATLKPSKSARPYRNQLVAEWLLRMPLEWGNSSPWMDRGTQMEPEARAYYEMHFGVEVFDGGFVLRDDKKVGGSPDCLVSEDGGLEIKVPALHTHVGYMLNPETLVTEYRHQVQGYLYLTERAWWDVMSYHPSLPAVIRRVEPDREYHAALDAALTEFLADLDAAKEQLAAHRVEPAVAASA